ncbi:hypothetical protein JTB14_023530 [Gonioctena quinquepunctata]|nr:hypothetical protein JTB14_023530 [Gonioctena quinquepunctata]
MEPTTIILIIGRYTIFFVEKYDIIRKVEQLNQSISDYMKQGESGPTTEHPDPISCVKVAKPCSAGKYKKTHGLPVKVKTTSNLEMGFVCCVPNCKNGGKFKMHRFPKTEKLFNEWVKIIGNPDLKRENLKSIIFVCDIHFDNEHRQNNRSGANLTANAIPTLHLPKPEVDPMSLIGLEGMDQIEFVIDSEDDKTDDNIDSSDNENISEDEHNDSENEIYTLEDFEETNSKDSESSDNVEEVPFKKIKISNVCSLNADEESVQSSNEASNKSRGTNRKQIQASPSPRKTKKASTTNPPSTNILLDVLTSSKPITTVSSFAQNNANMASTMGQQKVVKAPLLVTGGSHTPIKGTMANSTPLLFNSSPNVQVALNPLLGTSSSNTQVQLNPLVIPGSSNAQLNFSPLVVAGSSNAQMKLNPLVFAGSLDGQVQMNHIFAQSTPLILKPVVVGSANTPNPHMKVNPLVSTKSSKSTVKATAYPASNTKANPSIISGTSNVVHGSQMNKANSDFSNMVLVPDQKEFVLKEDVSRTNPCFVPGCKIYKNEQMYAFSVPRDKATLQLWDLCINNSNSSLDYDHVVCYKHFAQEDVIHNIKIIHRNGKDIALDEPQLKKGALPCVKFLEKCCVPRCGKSTGRMYTFPVTNKPSFLLWLYLIKNPNLKRLPVRELLKHRVCQVHFECDSFGKDGELIASAAPTLYMPESNPHIEPTVIEQTKNFSKKCAMKLCSNLGFMPNCKLFPFPENFEGIIRWLEACKRRDLIGRTFAETLVKLKDMAVCDDHFAPSDFENSMMEKLRKDAVPQAPKPRGTVPTESLEQHVKLTPIRLESCIYRGCKNKPNKEIPFFVFPSEKSRYMEWMKACGYKSFGKHFYAYKICRDHFDKDMVKKSGKRLSDTAVPKLYPDPKLIMSPTVLPKKYPNPQLTSQRFESHEKTETVLNFKDGKEVIVIRDNSTLDDPPDDADVQDELICAVRHCTSMYRLSEAINHRFPNPASDPERFDIWLKLVANESLIELSKDEIRRSYMVCRKHFESRFYSKLVPSTKEKVLSDLAVPTLNLPADSCLLKEWDYYKVRLKKYLDGLIKGAEDTPAKPVTLSWLVTDTVRLSDLEDKTRCVLNEDRLSFPGMGCDLFVSTDDKKAKFPYGVYRAVSGAYGLTKDVEMGENVHVHTAIIIDDDDDCERQVLQQLLDKRNRKTSRKT